MKTKKYPHPTVDAIIEKDNKIVLIKRKKEPFIGKWALPGGHVKERETVEDAVVRETKEETSLDIKPKEILGVYSDPRRDIRNTISTVFIVEFIGGKIIGGSDATEARWFDLDEIDFDDLAFDHGKIIRDYLKWKRKKQTFWSSK